MPAPEPVAGRLAVALRSVERVAVDSVAVELAAVEVAVDSAVLD